jgi:hypothetical protein
MNAVADVHPVLDASACVLRKAALFPIVAVLLLLEPAVGFVCGVMMFGGVFAAVVFEMSAAGPRFPFLPVLGLSLGFGVFYLLYHFLIALLVRD